MKKSIIPFILFFTLVNILAAQEVILRKDKYVLRESGKTYTGIYKEYDSEKRLVSATCIKNGWKITMVWYEIVLNRRIQVKGASL